jgi:hypothetical protein
MGGDHGDMHAADGVLKHIAMIVYRAAAERQQFGYVWACPTRCVRCGPHSMRGPAE